MTNNNSLSHSPNSMSQLTLSQKEEMFLAAKTAYYEGNPSMSDMEFDALEDDLRAQGSSIVNIVGAATFDRNGKTAHPSRMSSLGKIQMKADNKDLGFESVKKWMLGVQASIYEATPKYDGNAMNLVYRYGKLEMALSRGDGDLGREQISKMTHIVPLMIPALDNSTIEIRGEVMVPIEVFEKKYSEYMNPRNFVAGVLNREDIDTNILRDLVFVAYEIRVHDEFGGWDYLDETHLYLRKLGFNRKYEVEHIQFRGDDFPSIYDHFLKYRETCPFQLDGFVLKTEEDVRKEIGEREHHPLWAVAIKFPPTQAVTTVTHIEWNMGKSGAIVPVVCVKPTLLDGSTIGRVSGYNYQMCVDKGITPGATVKIAKAGDIIPQIIEVLHSGRDVSIFPERCQCGSSDLEQIGPHIYCKNPECDQNDFKKFASGIGALGVERVGGSTAKKIYESGFSDPFDIFDPNLFNEEVLVKKGWKSGRALEIILDEIGKITEIKLEDLIRALMIDDVGEGTSREIAKKIAGVPYDFAGKTKATVAMFEEDDSPMNKLIQEKIDFMMSLGIDVIYPTSVSREGKVKYILTGKPTTHRFKEEFNKFVQDNGYIEVENMKEADILIANDPNGSSSKIKKAQKAGLPILTYEEIVDAINKG